MLNSQYQVSEYNRRRGHIGGGINQFNNPYMFNQPVRDTFYLCVCAMVVSGSGELNGDAGDEQPE